MEFDLNDFNDIELNYECCICNEILNSDIIVCCKCNVKFHKTCLYMWYRTQQKIGHYISCPMCRYEHRLCDRNSKNLCCIAETDKCKHNIKPIRQQRRDSINSQNLDNKNICAALGMITGIGVVIIWLVNVVNSAT